MARAPRARGTARRTARYHHGDLRRALVRAGLALIARGGPEALTLRAAARRAGVSQTAPYFHFADKRALLAAVAEEGFQAMIAHMRQAVAHHPIDPLGRLRTLGLAYVEFARTHPEHFRVMFGPAVGDHAAHPSLHAAGAEAFELLRAAVAACQEGGLVIGEDSVAMAALLWAATHGLASLLVDGQLRNRGGEDPEALAERVAAAIFLGIAAPAGRAARAGDEGGHAGG
jgi:AcrR family transcriptional regulator